LPSITTSGKAVAIELQAALEAASGAKPRVVHDHGSEFVNRDVAAVIKTHNLIGIKTKPRHPESNAYAERFVRSVKTECTGRMVFFSRHRALTQYVAHYHEERNHQGLAESPAEVF
jgi:transposase InsO family protein